MITWHTEKRKITELKNWEDNPRTITEEEYKKLEASVKELGNFEPLVINVDGTVIAGNQRLRLAVANGDIDIEVSVPDRKLTPKEADKIGIVSNTHSGQWDMDKLVNNFEDILNELGLDDLLPEVVLEAKEDDYEEPEQLPSKVQLGEVWQLGKHRLMCGDSTKEEDVNKLMNGVKADMVFTDPPFPNNSEIMKEMIKNIDLSFVNGRKVCDGIQMWFWDNLQFPPFNEMVTGKHVWHKTNGWQANHYEEIYCFHNDNKRHEQLVFSKNNVGGNMNRKELGNHPTPKPIGLLCDIINKLNIKGNIILDLFGGSGSTLIACEQTDRICYMMELDTHYSSVIIDRWETLTGKKAVKI